MLKKVGGKPAVKPAPQRVLVSRGDASHAPENWGTGNRVFLSMAKTVNIGNYESIRVEYGEMMEVNTGETYVTARGRVLRSVLTGLDQLIKEALDVLKS